MKLLKPIALSALSAVLAAGLIVAASQAAPPDGGKPDAKPEGEKAPAVKVDDASFKCMLEMTQVGDFYVDNLSGDLERTVAVAKAGQGEYPQGTVIQLIPNEVMIKQQKGFSPITKDWEFLWIDVDKDGSKIFRRGFTEVNNRFEMNCFACHVKARDEFDLTCRTGQGCDPIPITRAMFRALQKSDPRCKTPPAVTEEDKAALKELGAVVEAMKAANASERPTSEDAPRK